ncbi:hypothetical protein [Streptomyces achromogenes]|uniref:hypothetical protein n=1 Tax=Streptomyces achromogenes TaxID=67255 RepID=UPI003702020A
MPEVVGSVRPDRLAPIHAGMATGLYRVTKGSEVLIRLKKAAVALAMAGAASAGLVTMGAGTATAAAAGYVNTYQSTIWPSSQYTAYGECQNIAAALNREEASTDPNTYLYCSDNGDGSANLWLRHWV